MQWQAETTKRLVCSLAALLLHPLGEVLEIPLLIGIAMDPVLLIGLGLGLLLMIWYVIINYRASRSSELGDVINFFLSTSGFVIGIKICFLALQSVAPFNSTDERLFIFIGGIAVIWVSVQNVLRVFPFEKLAKERNPQDPDSGGAEERT